MSEQASLELDLLQILKGTQSDHTWLDGWDESESTYNADWEFLRDDSRIREIADYLEFPTGLKETLSSDLHKIEPVGLFVWHCHRALSKGMNTGGRIKWPNIPPTLYAANELIYVYVFLSALEPLRKFYDSAEIPEAILRDTLSDFLLWISDYKARQGRWGFKEQSWLTTHFTGRLFKLGRLQFERRLYGHPYRFYHHRENARIKWQGLDEEPLPGTDWTMILKTGDPTLFVHIPATGPLGADSCSESFARAFPFFKTHFPEFSPHAFECSSWLLDPQLQDHLSPTSNIVQFLNRWHLTPEPGATDKQTIERVFGDVDENTETWPRTTSLQRAMLAFIEAGGMWKMGAGVIFPE
jgi:GNAT-like C-terminal domain/N-acyltransferase N-terminal domain